MKKRYGLFSKKASKMGVYDYSSPAAREDTISNLIENSALARQKNELYWKKMRRYYDGVHDINYMTDSFLEDMNIPWTPAQSTDGFIHVESQIDPDVPGFEFSPRTDCPAEGAKLREETVRRICDINSLTDMNIKAERRLNICGSNVWKVSWGASPVKGEEESDVLISAPLAEQIYTDPASDTVDGCEYIAYVYSMHSQKAKRIFEEDIKKNGDSFESYYNSTAHRGVVYEGEYEDEDTVTITEFWFRQPHDSHGNSHNKYKAGDIALCILINGMEVKYIPKYWQNTDCNMFPFVVSCKIPNEGSIWGKSELEQLIPLIDAADRELTFAQLNSAFCSNDVIIAEENAFADGEIPENSPGAVWKLRPGMMGKVQRLGNMSSSQAGQFNAYSMWQNMMEQTTGNFDVNQGKEPARVTTASGIALMNERAKSRQSLKKAGRSEGFKRLFRLIDITALEFYESGRNIKTKDTSFVYDRKSIESCDDKGCRYVPSPDIIIHVGDGIANSKAFTVSAINSLMSTPITPDNYKFVKAYIDLIGLPMRNEICDFLEERYSGMDIQSLKNTAQEIAKKFSGEQTLDDQIIQEDIQL